MDITLAIAYLGMLYSSRDRNVPTNRGVQIRKSRHTFEKRNFGGTVTLKTGLSEKSNRSSSIITAAEATIGRKVKHDKFGEGTIVSVADVNGDKKLTIAFDKQGIKMLMLSMAKLELL